MLTKLRIKFVAIIMASVAVVLAIVFTGICMSEQQRSLADVDEALSSAITRAGEEGLGGRGAMTPGVVGQRFGKVGAQGDWEALSGLDGDFSDGGYGDDYAGQPSEDSDYDLDYDTDDVFDDDFAGPRIGGGPDEERSLVPVAVYLMDGSGSLSVITRYTTASIDDDVLTQATSQLEGVQDGSGELSALGLVYQVRTIEGFTYVGFADASYASGWQSLAFTLVAAGLLTLAVFFVIALLLSKWALKPVEEAWTAQRQFVADASHELKTPLTVVLANTSILLKHPESSIASQSQWIESTQVEAESMQGLVNEMLELAQVESRVIAEHVPIDFSDMVAGQTLQFESVAFERGCSFDESIAEGITVSGDEQRLRKMVSTLIENALKYVDEGGSVDVSLVAQGAKAILSIHNTGSTISPEDLPHIFDRFYRTDKARTSGTGGFGLGLAIARETAREHDGDIICESNASGTTFTVTLPIA